jgi:hypothetical protein
MEIARSNPLSICFAFDPKSLLRQIAELFAGAFWGTREHRLPTYESRLAPAALPSRGLLNRRPTSYAPRWG